MSRLVVMSDGKLVEVRRLYRLSKAGISRAVLIPGDVLIHWGQPEEVILEVGERAEFITIRPWRNSDDKTG